MSALPSFLLLIPAVLVMVVVTSVPTAGQGGRGGGAAAVQEGRGGRGGGAPAPARPVPRRADSKPDLTGRWDGSGGALTNTVILEDHPGGFGITGGKSLIIDPPDGIIPYQPWALAERDRRRDDANGYEDPVGHCEFYDIGRIHSFAHDIMHAGDTVVINANQHITRVIDTKRRAHLPAGIRLWQGDPIGRWEGDTLVVESTNFNGKSRMAIGGDFYSADARVVERFAMLDSNTLRWTMTIDDPKVFTRPWTMTSAAPMRRVPALGAAAFDSEDTCHEGNVDLVHLKNVYDQARKTTGSQPK
ncbi:MAG: hypothetical protein ACRD3C_06470 [Vicinamibacterales bacterium]